jgi:hypothetical protein
MPFYRLTDEGAVVLQRLEAPRSRDGLRGVRATAAAKGLG